MMRWLALLALCACNRIFGLTGTVEAFEQDAKYFDAHPPTCRSDGLAPKFDPGIHQLPIDICRMYAPTPSGTAGALCGVRAATGPNDQPLDLVDLVPPPDRLTSIRFVPEGDLAVAFIERGANPVVEVFEKTDTLTWTSVATIPLPSAVSNIYLGTPSRGPQHHLIAAVYDNATSRSEDLEVVGSDASWHVDATYDQMELGVVIGAEMGMTPDGLRLVFTGYNVAAPGGGVFYTERATIADHFAPAQLLPGLQDVAYPYLTEDCGRLYFEALGTAFYLEQSQVL